MSDQYIFAGIAGYVGRPDATGSVGVFRRKASGGDWEHVQKFQYFSELFQGLGFGQSTMPAWLFSYLELHLLSQTSGFFENNTYISSTKTTTVTEYSIYCIIFTFLEQFQVA